MRDIIRKMNMAFISVVLFFVYFAVLGVSYLLYMFVNFGRHHDGKRPSYWENPSKDGNDGQYYQSAY